MAEPADYKRVRTACESLTGVRQQKESAEAHRCEALEALTDGKLDLFDSKVSRALELLLQTEDFEKYTEFYTFFKATARDDSLENRVNEVAQKLLLSMHPWKQRTTAWMKAAKEAQLCPQKVLHPPKVKTKREKWAKIYPYYGGDNSWGIKLKRANSHFGDMYQCNQQYLQSEMEKNALCMDYLTKNGGLNKELLERIKLREFFLLLSTPEVAFLEPPEDTTNPIDWFNCYKRFMEQLLDRGQFEAGLGLFIASISFLDAAVVEEHYDLMTAHLERFPDKIKNSPDWHVAKAYLLALKAVTEADPLPMDFDVIRLLRPLFQKTGKSTPVEARFGVTRSIESVAFKGSSSLRTWAVKQWLYLENQYFRENTPDLTYEEEMGEEYFFIQVGLDEMYRIEQAMNRYTTQVELQAATIWEKLGGLRLNASATPEAHAALANLKENLSLEAFDALSKILTDVRNPSSLENDPTLSHFSHIRESVRFVVHLCGYIESFSADIRMIGCDMYRLYTERLDETSREEYHQWLRALHEEYGLPFEFDAE
ncbi:MAG: hypothetical protein SP1CHLAM54_16350 [Chlamydiia bacterium]|nr:hypothetical protein [Chlamydiia bacterium]MCH9616524.1 hypothetical protein [Chlamydiia bacterium]MCH9629255.1 hypothetical protein [Chlamydiia bacterium]